MASLPHGQFNTEALVQPGVATSYNRRPGERDLHTTALPRPVVAEPWYKRNSFYEVVSKFHDDHCRVPNSVEMGRETHERFKNLLEVALRNMDICHRLEYKGSAYEGIKVNKTPQDPDAEFDIMVVMKGGNELQAHPVPGHPGYAQLVKPAAFVCESLVTDGTQLSESTSRKFFSALQTCINNSPEMRNRCILRRHGPSATQMDVHNGNTTGAKMYSVDWVPTYQLVGGDYYIAKELRDGDPSSMCWRQCFSLQEKEKLNGIDSDGGIRRKVIRVVKVIRNASPELRALSSFHFKMAAFYVFDDMPATIPRNNSWAFDRLGERVIDVLKKLEGFLDRGFMPLYFMRSANLLSKFSPAAQNNMRDRLHVLTTSETELIKLMQNYGR